MEINNIETLNQAESPINLVIVIDTLSGGGAEKTMLRLASALIEMGHQVKFIVISPIVSHAIPENLSLEFVYNQKIKRGFKSLYYYKTAKRLQAMLDKINSESPIDAIFSVLTETDRITQYLKNYWVFHCIRSNLYEGIVKARKGIFKQWMKKNRIQRIYKNKHMFFISKGAEKEVIEDIGAKPASSCVIYNPYPIEEIQRLAGESTVDYESYFIHVGRFSYPKRQDKLLKLYADSELSNPLILMGEGSDQETTKIKNLISEYRLDKQVHLLDFQKNPFPYIQNAIALLLTSDHESLSNVIIEALICGTPVIAYDCPCGPREILIDDLKEFLIPFNDADAFIAKLKALNDSRIRVTPKTANIERFAAKSIANQYLKQIRKVTQQKPD